jgi:hypothetical protein
MGGFFSSPESNSSVQVEEMGASGSKANASAMAPRMNGMNKNVEVGMNERMNTNASDPGTPGRNNRNKTRRNNVAINVNRLKNVVVEEPPQKNAGEGVVGNNQAGGRRHRKGSRKASRKQGHKNRRR